MSTSMDLVLLPTELKFHVARFCGTSTALSLALAHSSWTLPGQDSLLQDIQLTLYSGESNEPRNTIVLDFLRRLAGSPDKAARVRAFHIDFDYCDFDIPEPVLREHWDPCIAALKQMRRLRYLYLPFVRPIDLWADVFKLLVDRTLCLSAIGMPGSAATAAVDDWDEGGALKAALNAQDDNLKAVALKLDNVHAVSLEIFGKMSSEFSSAFGYKRDGQTLAFYIDFHLPQYWSMYLERIHTALSVPNLCDRSVRDVEILVCTADFASKAVAQFTALLAAAFPKIDSVKFSLLASSPNEYTPVDGPSLLDRSVLFAAVEPLAPRLSAVRFRCFQNDVLKLICPDWNRGASIAQALCWDGCVKLKTVSFPNGNAFYHKRRGLLNVMSWQMYP